MKFTIEINIKRTDDNKRIVDENQKPADIVGFEWKLVQGHWVLHTQQGIPTTKIVHPMTDASPKLDDTYALGGELARAGLVPTAWGVMEGHGYQFIKVPGGWVKTREGGGSYPSPFASTGN
jgi:hypothetical protein